MRVFCQDRPRGAGSGLRAGRASLLAGACLLSLLASAGCRVTETGVGPLYPRVKNSRVETREAPVPGWPVWVFVNEKQVGAYQTGANGEVPFNFQPYLAEALAAGGLRIEFRFQQPDGKVERQWYTLTPEQLRTGAR